MSRRSLANWGARRRIFGPPRPCGAGMRATTDRTRTSAHDPWPSGATARLASTDEAQNAGARDPRHGDSVTLVTLTQPSPRVTIDLPRVCGGGHTESTASQSHRVEPTGGPGRRIPGATRPMGLRPWPRAGRGKAAIRALAPASTFRTESARAGPSAGPLQDACTAPVAVFTMVNTGAGRHARNDRPMPARPMGLTRQIIAGPVPAHGPAAGRSGGTRPGTVSGRLRRWR